MKRCKLLSVILVFVILSLVLSGVVSASVDTQQPTDAPISDNEMAVQTNAIDLELTAKSMVLIEATTGQILYEENADEQIPPASITKIMTLLLVMEAMEEGKFTMDTKVTTSEHASSMGGSQIWLEPGEEMTVHDLLKATAISSANDATVALGEFVVGADETAFVDLMNKRAKELIMTGTVFKNASGLDADGHVSTARDIAIMSAELLKHEEIYEFTTTWMDELRGGETALVNTNKLIRFYEGATGLKTGTTDGAGSCLSASATRDELSLIAVVMGSATSDERFDAAEKLLDFGFANYEIFTPTLQSDTPNEIPVLGGEHQHVDIYYEDIESLVIPKGRSGDVTQTIEIAQDIQAPCEQNQTVGTIKYFIDNNEIGSILIKTKDSVAKMTFGYAYNKLFRSILGENY